MSQYMNIKSLGKESICKITKKQIHYIESQSVLHFCLNTLTYKNLASSWITVYIIDNNREIGTRTCSVVQDP